MFAKAAKSPAVPSHNALRVLRQLAFAGSTGLGLCTVAALTYDVHRRVRLAEQIIENKRTLRTSAPNYDATSSAKRLAVMMEAAEAGEFMGLESLKHKLSPQGTHEPEPRAEQEPSPAITPPPNPIPNQRFASPPHPSLNDRFEYVRGVPETNGLGHKEQSRTDTPTHGSREGRELVDGGGIHDQIHLLIQQKKEVQATNLFLQHFHPRAGERVSEKMDSTARALFIANCQQGNVFVARSLFERLELVTLDVDLWGMMMHYLAKKGHIESVGALFEKYQTRLVVPDHLLEVVLRCLLESRRLNAAKILFYKRLADDQNGGLCGAYLDGLWRKTRKRELVTSEFRVILSRLSDLGRQPTEKVFNPLVKSYIESGNHEDAEALVSDMPGRFGVQPGCRTLGLIVYGRALSCDWDGVMAGLREIHRLGYTQEKKNFAHVFDRVFLEYYPTHSGPQIYAFLSLCIQEFDLLPDRILHRHIIEALLERGDSESLVQIARVGEERQWNTGINQEKLLEILQARQISMQETPVGMWRMLQAAREQYGRVASTRRLMGAGADSLSQNRNVLQPIYRPAEEIFAKATQDLVSKQTLNYYLPLAKRMEQRIHAGKFADALKSFRRADSTGFLFHPVHIELAVIATILEHGAAGLKHAREIITTHCPYWNKTSGEYRRRFPRFVPIFFQQVMQLSPRGNFDVPALKLALFEFYKVCADTPNLIVKNHALVSVSRRLIQCGSAPGAIKLLRAFYLSKWRKSHGFDQVQLKMLMRAYAIEGKAKGVWWCMMTALARPEAVRRDFVVEAELLLPDLETSLSQETLNDELELSDDAMTLKEMVSALWKKHHGEAPFANARYCPERKKARRTRVITRSKRDVAALPRMSIQDMILSFDEEMELDFLIERKEFGEAAIRTWWAETSVPFQNRVLPEYREYPALPGHKLRSE